MNENLHHSVNSVCVPDKIAACRAGLSRRNNVKTEAFAQAEKTFRKLEPRGGLC
jgi:hypothetical protein